MTSWFIFLFSVALAAKDTITVKGIVTCNSQTAGNVVVRLWDKDMASDDLLGQMKTSRDGNFTLSGKEDNIEPYIQIEHMCRVEEAGCWKEVRFSVPKEYVNAKEPYDMTYVALDIHWPGEKEHCP